MSILDIFFPPGHRDVAVRLIKLAMSNDIDSKEANLIKTLNINQTNFILQRKLFHVCFIRALLVNLEANKHNELATLARGFYDSYLNEHFIFTQDPCRQIKLDDFSQAKHQYGLMGIEDLCKNFINSLIIHTSENSQDKKLDIPVSNELSALTYQLIEKYTKSCTQQTLKQISKAKLY